MFTDYYAENSCTAGRSTFITGQVCLRTGLCKVGIPGAQVGLQDRDVTIAQTFRAISGKSTGLSSYDPASTTSWPRDLMCATTLDFNDQPA